MLITITRADGTYYVNSANVEVKKFTDASGGSVSYTANLDGRGIVQLTEAEYNQFKSANEE